MTNEEIKYLQNKIKLAKAEAIKEFAERLKKEELHGLVCVGDIDYLVKEMTEVTQQ